MTMVTPRSGYDLEYYIDRVGEKTAGGYYLNAAQQGEPPGRWFGKGAETLGFTDGQTVEREPYLAVYQQTDPRTGEKLGRAPNGYPRFRQIFERKLAAEPHATFERRLELEREAGQETRRSPVYTDLTVAHNKSISVLHASFREQARRARLAGDAGREALWRGREERVQEILQEANHAGLPAARLDWQQRASKIATYRELYGIGDDREVIGREPTENAPEMRAAWHDAFAAITRKDAADVQELPDTSLEHMRATYQTETGWAPPHVGKQLQEVRLGAGTMRLKAIRAEAEARTAADPAAAARHATIASQARNLETKYREHESLLSEVMAERNLWDKLTEGGRRLAVQADLELRRRYPGRKIRPLETAEPQAPGEFTVEPGWLAELNEQRRVFREELEARQNVMVPPEDPDWEDDGPAWQVWEAQRDAILQPPKPEIRPAEGALEAAHQRDTEPERV